MFSRPAGTMGDVLHHLHVYEENSEFEIDLGSAMKLLPCKARYLCSDSESIIDASTVTLDTSLRHTDNNHGDDDKVARLGSRDVAIPSECGKTDSEEAIQGQMDKNREYFDNMIRCYDTSGTVITSRTSLFKNRSLVLKAKEQLLKSADRRASFRRTRSQTNVVASLSSSVDETEYVVEESKSMDIQRMMAITDLEKEKLVMVFAKARKLRMAKLANAAKMTSLDAGQLEKDLGPEVNMEEVLSPIPERQKSANRRRPRHSRTEDGSTSSSVHDQENSMLEIDFEEDIPVWDQGSAIRSRSPSAAFLENLEAATSKMRATRPPLTRVDTSQCMVVPSDFRIRK